MDEIKYLKLVSNHNRERVINMLHSSGSGHPGGSLSVIEILTTIYEKAVDFSERERTRVILSKGHAVPALYAELAEKGILRESDLATLRSLGSALQGHPSVARISEVDASTGLLGQGLSIGLGMALAKKMKCDEHKVFVICGDGEFTEGQNYEALAQAAAYKADNLILFIDENKLCLSGRIDDVLPLGSLGDKLKAFGWDVEMLDGHSVEEVSRAVDKALANNSGRPLAFVAATVKGKGISFMENQPGWHGGVMTEDQYKQALLELESEKEALNG